MLVDGNRVEGSDDDVIVVNEWNLKAYMGNEIKNLKNYNNNSLLQEIEK